MIGEEFDEITQLYHLIRDALSRGRFHEAVGFMRERTARIGSWMRNTPLHSDVVEVVSQTSYIQTEASRLIHEVQHAIQRSHQMAPARLNYEKSKMLNECRVQDESFRNE